MNIEQERQKDVWVKWDWLWKALFYAAVVASTWLMLLDDDRKAPVWLGLLLTGILLLWHWGGLKLAYRRSDELDDQVIFRFIVIIGVIVLWFALVNLSPAYYFTLFGLFGLVFRHLPLRYGVIAILILTGSIIYEQLADAGETLSLTNSTIWLFLFTALGAIVLGVWITAIIGQSTRRRQLIEQLEATQAELAAAERRAGILEERQRLARDIHDTLAQGFTSIVMHLEAADQALPDDLDTLQKHLDRARGTARTSLEQARRVVHALRPHSLDQRSLPDAIERTAVRWQEEAGIPLTTTITGDPVPLHPDIEVTLLRATQEALANIRKHAQATAVQITLSYIDDVVVLDVQDNGVSFAGAAASSLSGGYGLQAMRERAEQCGGSVTLESEPGEGTTVVVSIPIYS
ncbi:MAG: sensor histidine kinase [Anaerolineae bacterium]|uniref:sensor histidine kinase n=1 Tax=Promineifilum sp. TaxID=2664178 RepID=UPI001E153EC6|nr:sensor histidine kinase [Anaerolineales bacterium]MCB8934741.1 sensor histidine kinase [Promineifilum sp.]MCO5181512.1 sensor histidine kinase [Promineifilum sp.]MCW5847198.1 sensor histidine kinase [Anaerolineae bacterium]